MLKHLGKIGYIGDLSVQDADVLAQYAKKSKNILEFGVGGSTQIMAQCKPKTMISIDTDLGWIERTKINLARIKDKTEIMFGVYAETTTLTTNLKFDLVLIDGVDHLRKDFAVFSWTLLNEGGVMLFHDTRRPADFLNAVTSAGQFVNEVRMIEVNVAASNGKSSNITILHKKKFEPYEDWNVVEGKPAWAYGGAPFTKEHEFWKQPQ
jgi:predicted O-methyltransferase YrrM